MISVYPLQIYGFFHISRVYFETFLSRNSFVLNVKDIFLYILYMVEIYLCRVIAEKYFSTYRRL